MARFKPRSRLAAVSGTPKFGISGDDWTRIEKAYGQELVGLVRRKIFYATSQYLEWIECETTAPPLSNASERVRTIKSAALQFRETVLRCPEEIAGDADFHARHLISKHMGLPFDGRNGLHNVVFKLSRDITKGCDRALVELKRDSGSGWRGGETWQLWVRNLTSILKKYDLPTSVRKDTDKATAAEPSPFVAFMRELQKCIPKAYRRSEPAERGSKAILRFQQQ